MQGDPMVLRIAKHEFGDRWYGHVEDDGSVSLIHFDPVGEVLHDPFWNPSRERLLRFIENRMKIGGTNRVDVEWNPEFTREFEIEMCPRNRHAGVQATFGNSHPDRL